MLRKIRICLQVVTITLVTLLLLGIGFRVHLWAGWVAKIQFLPAVLALNFGVVALLIVAALLFGRLYCSVVCPLGIMQDFFSWLGGKFKKNRFSYAREIKWLRYGVWVLFVVAFIAGINALVALLAPYSSWGRIVQNLLAPVWQWGNNLLAAIAERRDSYAFYTKEVWLKSLPTFIVALVSLIVVVILAWRNGRTYCNAICPVGTTLSFFSRFAMFRPVIEASKCKSCHVCEKKCKAACIDIDGGKTIDYSRCVDCFNCLDNCKFGALKYRFAWGQKSEAQEAAPADKTRRAFIVGSAIALGGAAIPARAQTDEDAQVEIQGEGGFADIIPKVAPKRSVEITPFGSESVEAFYKHCTACQLCVSVCPNNVLRPSKKLSHLMQPEMSFERGYCRPECVKCSEVCPAGAILKITPEEKTQWKVGTASIQPMLCLVENGEVEECGNCSRHCPVGAIHMVRKEREDGKRVMVPSVEEELCIGCGACENLCPARPISAITVNGYQIHHKA